MTATAITGAAVFDGVEVIGSPTVVIDEGRIVSIGGDIPAGAEVVDGAGATVLPGLIDAHVHTDRRGLALALRFGVTTELEMQGANTRGRRDAIEDDDSVADVRSAGFGFTPPGGHPSELMPKGFNPGAAQGASGPERSGEPPYRPDVSSPRAAAASVSQLVERGSDYIKFMIDDGSVEGHPGLPVLDPDVMRAAVAEAKTLGVLTVAHALTIDATRAAVEAGVDGLAHVFIEPPTDEIIGLLADSGVFVIACAVLNASMMGITGDDLADDPRVGRRLDPEWDATLRSSFDRYPQGRVDDVLETLRRLEERNVEVLVGTDVSQPLPAFGGLAHGASVHHELQYLVRAGFSPSRALRAATSATADRFGLHDRGWIAEDKRADLLLVDGDPTTSIGDTLNTRAIWRRGSRLPL